MTTYEHKCFADGCEFEWEAVYGMTEDPPTLCPDCNVNGKVKRLISGGSGKGIVRLAGMDLRNKLKADGVAMRRRASTDENYKANIIGEDVYHQQQLGKDSLTADLVRIGKDASKIKSTDTKPQGKIKRVSKGTG